MTKPLNFDCNGKHFTLSPNNPGKGYTRVQVTGGTNADASTESHLGKSTYYIPTSQHADFKQFCEGIDPNKTKAPAPKPESKAPAGSTPDESFMLQNTEKAEISFTSGSGKKVELGHVQYTNAKQFLALKNKPVPEGWIRVQPNKNTFYFFKKPEDGETGQYDIWRQHFDDNGKPHRHQRSS